MVGNSKELQMLNEGRTQKVGIQKASQKRDPERLQNQELKREWKFP